MEKKHTGKAMTFHRSQCQLREKQDSATKKPENALERRETNLLNFHKFLCFS